MSTHAVPHRLARRLACHQALFDPRREPRNRLRWLPELRRWQAQRLREGFARFLADPARRPAAEFFLTDVYGDHDFSRRDADIARVLPAMQRLLPGALLETVADAIELGALTQALDLRMAKAAKGIRLLSLVSWPASVQQAFLADYAQGRAKRRPPGQSPLEEIGGSERKGRHRPALRQRE